MNALEAAVLLQQEAAIQWSWVKADMFDEWHDDGTPDDQRVAAALYAAAREAYELTDVDEFGDLW